MMTDWRGRALRCPNPRKYDDPRADGGVRYEPCGRSSCTVCAAQKVLTLIKAINLAPLAQSGVVTLPDADLGWTAAARLLRSGTNAAFRFVRQETGIVVPRATIIEVSDAGRVHLHVVTRGRIVSPDLFAHACIAAGLGFADLQRVRYPKTIARYVFKTILPPPGQPLIAEPTALTTFRLVNAGRLINTRGQFWIDRHGTPLGSAADAVKIVHRDWRRSHPPETSSEKRRKDDRPAQHSVG